ncbi:MAG: hypothetical protein ACFFB0_00040 [Promethearchaeota archaeon]
MEGNKKKDMNYYEFLNVVFHVSKNSQSIQNNVIKKIYENFHVCQVINNLDKQIETIDNLLTV